MNTADAFQIITFYKFLRLDDLPNLRQSLKNAMREHSVLGTVILAAEGINSTVCAAPPNVEKFVAAIEEILDTKLNRKSSFHAACPFRRAKVKIKSEIVTLKQTIDFEKGIGTHASVAEWNEIISDAETVVLDARNDYEYKIGTFKGAVNPHIERFSDLPRFVAENFNPETHKRIAMFCTGGVRCEKFAPYLKELGYAEVFQLDGGILRYLEETPDAESLWTGECFVFDERVSVDENLRKGNEVDLSVKRQSPPND